MVEQENLKSPDEKEKDQIRSEVVKALEQIKSEGILFELPDEEIIEQEVYRRWSAKHPEIRVSFIDWGDKSGERWKLDWLHSDQNDAEFFHGCSFVRLIK